LIDNILVLVFWVEGFLVFPRGLWFLLFSDKGLNSWSVISGWSNGILYL